MIIFEKYVNSNYGSESVVFSHVGQKTSKLEKLVVQKEKEQGNGMLGAGPQNYVPGMIAGGDLNESMMSVIPGG